MSRTRYSATSPSGELEDLGVECDTRFVVVDDRDDHRLCADLVALAREVPDLDAFVERVGILPRGLADSYCLVPVPVRLG